MHKAVAERATALCQKTCEEGISMLVFLLHPLTDLATTYSPAS